MEVEEALKQAGSWGKYQKYLLILLFLSGIPNGFIAMHFVLSNYKPEHRCKLPGESQYMNATEDLEILISAMAIQTVSADGQISKDSCHYIDRELNGSISDFPYGSTTNVSEGKIKKCENGYVYKLESNQKTAVSEFSMVCDGDWWVPISLSVYQVGCGAGAILTSLGDNYGKLSIFLFGFGRRMMFRITCVMHILSGICISLSWNLYAYNVFNFFTGLFAEFNCLMNFVIAAEMTDVSKRNLMTIISFSSYTVGYSLVAPVGYLQQDWRWYLGTACGLGALIYAPGFCLLPETVGWLVEKGRTRDARELLFKIAKTNGKSKSIEKVMQANQIIKEKGHSSVGMMRNLRILFGSGIGSRYVVLGFGWVVSIMMYYAVSWFSTSFSDDRFLNILFSALSEFPAYFICCHAVAIIGRPRSQFVFMMIAAVSTIVLPFVPRNYTIACTILSVVGKGAISAASFVCYLLSPELAPTLQRSTCISFCASCARLGSISAHYIMYIGKVNKFLPSIILTAAALISGTTAIFYLPETVKFPIPDTIEQAKANKRIYGFNILKKFEPTSESSIESEQTSETEI